MVDIMDLLCRAVLCWIMTVDSSGGVFFGAISDVKRYSTTHSPQ